MRRGAVKNRETTLASNQFPKCSPQPGTPREIELSRESRGREETEVPWGRKVRVKRGENNQTSNHTPK